MVRSGTDQTMEISPCNLAVPVPGDGSGGRWRLQQAAVATGLLTQTNSSC
ncbi:hypothetical protein [Kibdelosporangium aridum]|nr:hypothetical protein [Kibdelosporangium aridum]